jgi:heme-degrading monooxygenase HmoA
MIARMWHGRVTKAKAEEYRAFLIERAIPDYRSIPGNLNVYILERDEADITHFVTLTLWENLAAIRVFAGDDPFVAKYYPEDHGYLLEFEPTVIHYEVSATV